MNNHEANNRDRQIEDDPSNQEHQQPGYPPMAASAMDGVAVAALRSVLQHVHQAAERSGRSSDRIRVVAVSKTKPVSLVRQVYDAGHRSFGENYVQEIVEKAPQLPEDIEWHFIGNLQSNKVKPLLTGVPNLAMVETVDDQKIANNLNRMVENIGRKPLRVFVQVNTSGEESKFGVHPSGCLELVKHVSMACPNLEFCGLMTIGMPDYTSTPENFKVVFLLIYISFGSVVLSCSLLVNIFLWFLILLKFLTPSVCWYQTLASCRSEVCEALGIAEEQCELSMGMSGDFELAVELGSTNVRIGSTIFGAREYPKKQLN
ncbi:hypothetical protein RHMOL_Rhmol13G0199600 [Rhododendron molle]|uniref:Uncharacterized protein n=1 Tax=Rhododendron molle TaxID=49168 RepID=A0ACC0L987_RHOML|nr:hypothetical protein RHMOL_Rhmol13G0199600 [Rhododendron molle]